MRIVIETIPHADQRYPTIGDYVLEEDGTLRIRVSDLDNWKYEFLVALHELIEAGLCMEAKVGFGAIDHFDQAWTAREGILEPGDDRNAPYYRQHQLATGVERTLAALLDVDWDAYTNRIDEVGE